MAQDEHGTRRPPVPDPAVTAGLEPGGGVQPGDTPPAADSMSGANDHRSSSPNMGPVSGNSTPMFFFLGILGLVVLMCAVFIGAQFFPS